MKQPLNLFYILVVSHFCLSAFACEPARIAFEGTPFAESALQIENDKIYFYRGTAEELAVYYRAKYKKWCYEEATAGNARPQRGCLTRKLEDGKRLLLVNGKPVKNFVLRDAKQGAVATVSVIGKMLTASFVSENGKPLEKRAVFTSVTSDFGELLEAHGYNCPNPKFLTCAGGELISGHGSEGGGHFEPIKVVDLAKPLAHFRFSCNGVTEYVPGDETKRAPSLMEPGTH